MNAPTTAIDLLHREISDPDTQWSLNTFGAIAEFSRDHDEPARLTQSFVAVSAVTARGGITLRHHPRSRPFASEGITKAGWNQRIAVCLPASDCTMNRRSVLTEIGAEHEALRPEDRESVRFDLGFGALQDDFHVRIGDRDIAGRLREYAGRSLFEPGNPAMGMILAANPHRVFASRLGSIEVYQPIPHASGKSPDGPHTHVLPKLLKSGRTHPATEPILDGWVPCAHIFPPHPARNGLGDSRPFDAAGHRRFQQIMTTCGDRDALAIKQRVVDPVRAGEPPAAMAGDRHGRTSIRIALRQMKAEGHASPALAAWLVSFDQGRRERPDDGAAVHHNC